MRLERRTASRVSAVVVLIISALATWAILIEPGRVRFREVDIALRDTPPSLRGLRVAAMGDIHTGAPHISADKLRGIVADVNRAAPDVVVLLGDYVIHGVVGGSFVDPETTAAILARLRAPGGVIAVLGNHDWWYDGERVRRALQSQGIVVLENAAHPVPRASGKVWIAGLDDLWTGRPDIDAALSAVPEREPVLLLTHSPDVFPRVPLRVSVTLAAHTHGGQVRVPPFPPPVVPSDFGARYAAGHIVEGGRHLFVTTGIGTSIVPVRFAVPPEVALLTLR